MLKDQTQSKTETLKTGSQNNENNKAQSTQQNEIKAVTKPNAQKQKELEAGEIIQHGDKIEEEKDTTNKGKEIQEDKERQKTEEAEKTE